MQINEALKVLNLSVGYTPTDLKKSYRKMVHLYHPDKGGKADDFLKIQKAYELLSTTKVAHMTITHSDLFNIVLC